MRLHKEGFLTIGISIVVYIILNVIMYFCASEVVFVCTLVDSTIILLFLSAFFREPARHAVTNYNDAIVAPADGKIVVIEEVFEPEVLKRQCLQVSIFMSVFNVHINWYPINGEVKYVRHHNGEFMAAYIPKSSTMNERSSIVIKHENGTEILVRQVAGALARRIVTYAKEGYRAKMANQMGFIKFGSRVDLYLPLDTKINVSLDDKVRGSQTILGWLQ